MENSNQDIEEFLNYIQYEKRLSNHTIISYRTDLKQLHLFVKNTFHIDNLTEVGYNEIRMWIVTLKEKEIANRSINRKISTLKSLFKYFLMKEKIEINPMLKVISPKQSQKLPVYFDQKLLDKLFNSELFTKDHKGVRDILILEILCGTGIRLSELIHIKVSDIDKQEIKVLGKGNKERIVPISNNLATLIPHYIAKRNETFPNATHPYLFFTDKGDKLYEKLVYRIVNHYLGLVTKEKKRSPHTMRHSYATNMLNNGAQLHTIKEILGHANLSATQVYTHNSIERLKDAYKKYHPKEN